MTVTVDTFLQLDKDFLNFSVTICCLKIPTLYLYAPLFQEIIERVIFMAMVIFLQS